MNRTAPGFHFRATCVVVVLMATITPLSFGQTRDRESGLPGVQDDRPARGRDLMAQLNLSSDQIIQIKAIRDEHRDARRLASQRVRTAQRALDEAIYGPVLDEAAVEVRARELSQAEGEALRLRALGEIRIRKILTDEQLATLRELRRQARLNGAQRRMRPGFQQRQGPPGQRMAYPRSPKPSQNRNDKGTDPQVPGSPQTGPKAP